MRRRYFFAAGRKSEVLGLDFTGKATNQELTTLEPQDDTTDRHINVSATLVT